LIRRDVFEELSPHTSTYTNGGASLPDGAEIKDFFRVEVDKEKQHLLSEDYFFCHSYRQIGGKVWIAPWVRAGHFGSHLFNGHYARSYK
jgi:hypothetical protein